MTETEASGSPETFRMANPLWWFPGEDSVRRPSLPEGMRLGWRLSFKVWWRPDDLVVRPLAMSQSSGESS